MKKIFFALIFLYAFNSAAFCQSNNVVAVDIVAKLKSFYTGRIVEKAYLHFDRHRYMAGDTIYFKAYVTFGEQHELSGQSRILYIDLISPVDSVIRSIKLQLKGGIAWGDFALPGALPTGNYRIRAYTGLMRDQGLTNFFQQTIPISSVAGDKAISPQSFQATNPPELQFFPEGGNLVAGLNSKVAFKAINSNGSGLDVKGVVVDNTGQTVAAFNSRRLGMGYFNLQPEVGKTYKANLVFANGIKSSIDLPKADTKGIALALDNSDPDVIKIRVSSNKAYFDENQNKEVSLVINSGVAVSSGRIRLSSQLFSTNLKKSQFRTGIVQFTLFSPEGDPLCERLVFVNRPDLLKLSINTGKTAFKPRERVAVNITCKNKDDSLTAGHFSVAVINENEVHIDENKENSILSWLLLSSDLKGYIEQPGYYFAHTDTVTNANLDVLMLTQGYRRFVWKQVLNDKYPTVIPTPENSLKISGLVTSSTGKPMVKEKVALVSLNGGPILNQLTDTAGRFNFTGLDFADSARFILRAGNERNRNNLKIRFDKDKPAPVTNTGFWPDQQVNADSVTVASQGKVLSYNAKALSAKSKTLAYNENDAYKTESLAGAGHADQVLHNKDLGDGILLEKLAVLLNGVEFSGDFSSAYVVRNLHGTLMKLSNTALLIVVDGVKGVGLGSLNSLQTTDVETVELLKSENASMYGADGSGGVLLITTKNAKDPTISSSTGVLQIRPTGFYKAREFYSPSYDNASLANKQGDLRPTIYWKPEIITDKDGKAEFEYYNADAAGTYRIVIEGIDDKGYLGRQVYRYKVE